MCQALWWTFSPYNNPEKCENILKFLCTKVFGHTIFPSELFAWMKHTVRFIRNEPLYYTFMHRGTRDSTGKQDSFLPHTLQFTVLSKSLIHCFVTVLELELSS